MILPRIVKRTHLGLPDAYIVESEDLFRTFMPWTVQPLTETMVSSGFMDDRGRVHYEFNHNLYDPRKYMNWRSLLRPKIYYEALVTDFLGTSLLKDEKRLISGGHFVYDFRKKENYLMNLVILPRRLVPDMDETIRRNAIFIFQKSFDRLTARLGGEYERTATLVIPDEKMKELGYERYRSKSLREAWGHIKEWWPISLRGFQRQYVKKISPSV
ncbi:MAG TPA: hypothetical protein VFX30_02860 [bacterium]|nr:hypothetical protein [bacterium]